MRERPILFNGDMVRAILEGRKTVTRRAVKSDLIQSDRAPLETSPGRFHFWCSGEHASPFGAPGDRLWVRETWAPGATRTMYRAGCNPCYLPPSGRWKPSIHMPRSASRILLEVTAVRVERLQDITEERAKAEGVRAIDGMKWHTLEEAAAGIPMRDHTALDAFSALWECINGEGSWAANPWVWVIEFNRVEAAHA
jgi:hypothetical protein